MPVNSFNLTTNGGSSSGSSSSGGLARSTVIILATVIPIAVIAISGVILAVYCLKKRK